MFCICTIRLRNSLMRGSRSQGGMVWRDSIFSAKTLCSMMILGFLVKRNVCKAAGLRCFVSYGFRVQTLKFKINKVHLFLNQFCGECVLSQELYFFMVFTYSLPGTILLFISKLLLPIFTQELYFSKNNWRLSITT